ncbi:MAG: glycosyltransferase family 4 protein [Saccharofermentanales bacterium]
MKKIWLINQYNMPPAFGHLNRHYNFGKYLKRLGHEPAVFVGSFLHNTSIQMIADKSRSKRYEPCDFPYFFIRTCDYSSSKIRRVFAMFQFTRNLYKVTKDMERPDAILGSSAHPLAAIAAIRLGRKYQCRSIVEIRDLWPESLVAYGILGRRNPLLRLLYAGEKWIYRHADDIVFTMEGGRDYIIGKGWDKEHGGPVDIAKVHHINNGVDLEVFNADKSAYVTRDEDLDDPDTFKVIYAGSIRLVNNVRSIVDAARYIQQHHSGNIRFLIYGAGSDREELERYCADNQIRNVVFKGLVDKKFIPYILSRSDLNILHFDDSPLKQYGVSLNKMFEYFASGRPTVSDCAFGYDLIARYGCGITSESADPRDLAEAVIRFSTMPADEYDRYCRNALQAAGDYDFRLLAQQLETLVLQRN